MLLFPFLFFVKAIETQETTPSHFVASNSFVAYVEEFSFVLALIAVTFQ